MRNEATLQVQGEHMRLLPERAAYWEEQQTLFIADPHFGKAASFRAAAIPVPAGTTEDNLARLDTALKHTNARRLICLGDLLHARSGRSERTLRAVAEWRKRHSSLEFCLVQGNHDHHAGEPPPEWGMRIVEEPLLLAPFVCCHKPNHHEQGYVLAGHLHPAVWVGHRQFAERLPCFYFGPDFAVLPAFGEFTGMAILRPSAEDRVFVLADEEVIPVP